MMLGSRDVIVTVRNTFIEVIAEPRLRTRQLSLPAGDSSRCGQRRSPSHDRRKVDFTEVVSNDISVAALCQTESKCSLSSDASSDASGDCEAMLAVVSATESCKVCKVVCSDASTDASGEMEEDCSSSGIGTPTAQHSIVDKSGRSPLNPEASAWMPFQFTVMAIAEEVAASLSKLGLPLQTLQTEVSLSNTLIGQDVCTLIAKVPREHLRFAERLIMAAKQAIYEGTCRSRGVCLLGFKTAPFRPTATGFEARLATVAAKRQECRKLYADGFCRHGDHCFRQHPTAIVSFSFALVAA